MAINPLEREPGGIPPFDIGIASENPTKVISVPITAKLSDKVLEIRTVRTPKLATINGAPSEVVLPIPVTPPERGKHSKMTRRAFLFGAAATGAVLAVEHQINKDNSLLARLAKRFSWIGDIFESSHTTFNNQEDYGKIGSGNSIGIPPEEIREAARIENGKAIYMGSLFGPDITGDITYVKGLPFWGVDETTYEELKKAGVKNTMAFTDIPLGTTVMAPFVGKASRLDSQWSETSLSLTLVFQDDAGKWHSLLFSGARNVEMIIQAPKLNPDSRFSNLNSWVDVKVGDPLFKIQSKELVGSSNLKGFSYPSQLRIDAGYSPNGLGKNPSLPINIFFLTRNEKILSPVTS